MPRRHVAGLVPCTLRLKRDEACPQAPGTREKLVLVYGIREAWRMHAWDVTVAGRLPEIPPMICWERVVSCRLRRSLAAFTPTYVTRVQCICMPSTNPERAIEQNKFGMGD